MMIHELADGDFLLSLLQTSKCFLIENYFDIYKMATDTQKAIDLSLLSDQLAKLFGFADGVSDIVEHLFTIDSKDVSWAVAVAKRANESSSISHRRI
jgi:hypothetical protein